MPDDNNRELISGDNSGDNNKDGTDAENKHNNDEITNQTTTAKSKIMPAPCTSNAKCRTPSISKDHPNDPSFTDTYPWSRGFKEDPNECNPARELFYRVLEWLSVYATQRHNLERNSRNVDMSKCNSSSDNATDTCCQTGPYKTNGSFVNSRNTTHSNNHKHSCIFDSANCNRNAADSAFGDPDSAAYSEEILHSALSILLVLLPLHFSWGRLPPPMFVLTHLLRIHTEQVSHCYIIYFLLFGSLLLVTHVECYK